MTFPRDENPNRLLGLARDDLACYGAANVPQFELARHLRILIDRLEAIERGDLRRLIVCMPPRYGKSLTCSTLFPAWYLGRHPERSVISASYGQELADDFGRRVRNLLASPRHEAIFPDCRLSEDSTAAHRFSTTRGGTYFAVGRGAAITGRGADVLLIDDPLKDREEADSATTRRLLKDWYAQVAFTRLTPRGAVVIIATRWHEDDLVGWLLRDHSSEGWEVLSFPAVGEENETFRHEGEALWPERFPVEQLEKIRLQIGGAAWASLYQQRPAPVEGAIFRREWWRTYGSLPQFRRIVQSWDSAFKIGVENDFSACTTWGEAEDGWYLLAAWRGRVEFPELKRRVSDFAAAWKAGAILVEDAASGQPLIQELQRNSRLPIIPVKPKGDKVSRANAVTALIEAGRVLLPANAGWTETFLDEVSAFPTGAHDDFVDSMTQALNYMQQSDRGGVLTMLAAMEALAPKSRIPERILRDPYLRANLVELPEGYVPPRSPRPWGWPKP